MKKEFEFGDMSITFDHIVRVEENKSVDEE